MPTIVDALGCLQQNRPAVGAGLLLVELGVQRLVEQIREQNSLWYSVGRHAGASVVAQVVVNTALVPHGGSCVCTGIGTRREFSGLTVLRAWGRSSPVMKIEEPPS